jgi:hypothetical protein
MGNDKRWLAPLTGIAFIVLAIVGFAMSGEPPSATDEPAAEIVRHYVDNEGSVMAGGILAGFGASLFVFFAGVLRRALRNAEGDQGILSAVAFGGAVIFATGLAIDGTISVALAEAADDIDPTAVQALQALWDNDFLPLAVGLQVFALATGISILRHGALPKWLGFIAILAGIAAITPAWFVAFGGTAIVVLVASVLLTMRARAESGGQTPAV